MFKTIRKKLSNQLSFYIVISVLSVFIIIGITTYVHLSNELEKKIQIETSIKNKAASQDIRNFFKNAKIISQQMSFNNEIRTYLNEVKSKNDILTNRYYDSTLKTIKGIEDSNDFNFLIWISNERANFYLDSNANISDNSYIVNERPWYESAIKSDEVVFTPIYKDFETGSEVISAILALREKGSIYGFIGVQTNFDYIPSIYSDIDVGDKGKIFLVSDEGTSIYTKNNDKNQTVSIFDSDNILSPYADIIFKEKEGFKEVTIDNKKWYLSYYPATDNGWISIYLISKSETKKGLFPFLFIIIFTLMILLLLVIIYYTINDIIEPIHTITNYSKQVSSGDFSHSLPPKYLKREDEIGDLTKSFVIITDVFREKNMLLENRIKLKNEEIQKQYQYIIENEKLASLGTLVAGVAHEINTPIGVALTSNSYIQKICKETIEKFESNTMKKRHLVDFMDDLDESTDLLLNNIYRSADLIRSFKQIAVNQNSETKSNFLIKDTIDSIITSLRHEYKNRNILIENYCPKFLSLDSYPGPFSQVITNLIMNSLHHAYKDNPSGGLIVIRAHKIENKVEIHYTDDGVGIEASNIPKIFDPFFTTNRQDGNSGLGLHIVYNIVSQLLDGSITYEDNNGSGVHFIITLPLVVSEKSLLYK